MRHQSRRQRKRIPDEDASHVYKPFPSALRQSPSRTAPPILSPLTPTTGSNGVYAASPVIRLADTAGNDDRSTSDRQARALHARRKPVGVPATPSTHGVFRSYSRCQSSVMATTSPRERRRLRSHALGRSPACRPGTCCSRGRATSGLRRRSRSSFRAALRPVAAATWRVEASALPWIGASGCARARVLPPAHERLFPLGRQSRVPDRPRIRSRPRARGESRRGRLARSGAGTSASCSSAEGSS